LRREIKAHSAIKMASFTAFRVAKGNLSGKSTTDDEFLA
jgi:hypothetical protein